ncbi:Plasmid conjugative transfer entry exclusion protein TraS [Enterobacter hormaechei]|uniref:hypothetical protein n=1 Tax=Enterobacter hormaechei TaxID=158836 RepID=UPI000799981F|nr:hypothetical protein [Enterobacter hormaechei]SAG77483.1 Plasmid conjugative transfer entry exclusion protein TraS [Enterobacter hormaechei]
MVKELVIIVWACAVQLLSCYLSSYAVASSAFLVVMSALWYTLFLLILINIKNKSRIVSKDISLWVYVLSAIPAVLSPLISIIIFFGVSIYRLCKVSNVTVLDGAFKEQFVFNGNDVRGNDDCSYEVDINPATGLEMCGATDIAGNLYGSSNHP